MAIDCVLLVVRIVMLQAKSSIKDDSVSRAILHENAVERHRLFTALLCLASMSSSRFAVLCSATSAAHEGHEAGVRAQHQRGDPRGTLWYDCAYIICHTRLVSMAHLPRNQLFEENVPKNLLLPELLEDCAFAKKM